MNILSCLGIISFYFPPLEVVHPVSTCSQYISFLLEKSDSFLRFQLGFLQDFEGENFVGGFFLDDLHLAKVTATDSPHHVKISQGWTESFNLA